MSTNKIVLNKSNGDPSVEVIVGHARWGNYNIKIWDSNDQNPDVVGQGFSGDTIADEFIIGNVASLNNRILSWKVRVAAFDTAPNGLFHVTIILRQNNKPIANGVFTYSGTLDGVKTLGDFTRIIVV